MFLLGLSEDEINWENPDYEVLKEHLYRVQKFTSGDYYFRKALTSSIQNPEEKQQINSFGFGKNGWATHVPARVKILEASEEKPYISFRIKFDMKDIYEAIKSVNPSKLTIKTKSEKGLFFDDLNKKIYEPVNRLFKLLDREKEEIEYLYPLIIKEILFILTNDKSGYFLNKFATQGTISNKIVKVISEIKNNFNEKLNVKELANLIKISEASLYQNFKTITSMSPIQFQKKIRLEEAKLMLINQNLEANEVAFAVGYESPSQFSREYSRMYGMSPKAHSEFLKTKSTA
jgi:AraC-like DNA-binding protein